MKKIETITSAENPLIRRLSVLAHSPRRAAKENVFLVEGLRLAEMAARSDGQILHAVVTERALAAGRLAASRRGSLPPVRRRTRHRESCCCCCVLPAEH